MPFWLMNGSRSSAGTQVATEIATVADSMLASSASVNARLLTIVTDVLSVAARPGPSMKPVVVPAPMRDGASLTLMTVNGLSTLGLLAVPSLTTKRITRAVVPGFWELLLYTTLRSVSRYSVSDANGVVLLSVRVPVAGL